MGYILANLIPILAATVASLLFGHLWLRVFAPASAARMTVGRSIVAFVAEFWLASILAGALILAPPQAGEWTMAVMTPIVIWIGFLLPVLAITLPYRGHNVRTVLSDAGLWLGTMVLQAVLLKLIGLTPPQGG